MSTDHAKETIKNGMVAVLPITKEEISDDMITYFILIFSAYFFINLDYNYAISVAIIHTKVEFNLT